MGELPIAVCKNEGRVRNAIADLVENVLGGIAEGMTASRPFLGLDWQWPHAPPTLPHKAGRPLDLQHGSAVWEIQHQP